MVLVMGSEAGGLMRMEKEPPGPMRMDPLWESLTSVELGVAMRSKIFTPPDKDPENRSIETN